MYCRFCGSEISEDHRFCANCGNQIAKEPLQKKPAKAGLNVVCSCGLALECIFAELCLFPRL